MSAHEITAAILLAYDQEGSCAMGVKKAEEIVSAALADAFRAGQIAQYNQILLGTFVVTKLLEDGLASLTEGEANQVVRTLRGVQGQGV